ncbi:MAG: hypothetical protein A3B70_01155 [Deltaproteobacteria bacterium RIFCSPHIGHO2_02_FULL_40_11]|nr:MAG: hypothetical protein A3B70_01155 [Deltaproteobacteria bacterium RIFCSPHIGHO2_02_FULL_40_11]
MYCTNCGTKSDSENKFCTHCGANLSIQDSVKPTKLFEGGKEISTGEPVQNKRPHHKDKLILPLAIILACSILGGILYAIQISKQKSIEKQQLIELEAKTKTDQIKMAQDKAKAEKDRADEAFSNNLKCQALLKDLKQRWNNVVGIYYSEWQNTCIVKYTEKGETQESPIESMQDK